MTAVLDKHDRETGTVIIRNQTPSNYNTVANQLTIISNRLPELCPENFSPDTNGRYLINPTQVRDAYDGKVDSLKDHIYEACFLFLHNKLSGDCLEEKKQLDVLTETEIGQQPISPEPIELIPPNTLQAWSARKQRSLMFISIVLFGLLLFAGYKWYTVNQRLTTLTHDMRILPYKPSAAEIAALEGVWKIYTASPQARKWDTGRYHKTVPNMMEINYKNGYFVFNRYGPAFNQDGFMQLEAPGIVSIHSRVLNDSGNMASPKHSLMVLEKSTSQLNVISASWNFDAEDNRIIGIREVYIKKGQGTLAEIKNSLLGTKYDRVLQWSKPNQQRDTIVLTNHRIEVIDEKGVRELVDENSIVLKDPDSTLILKVDPLGFKIKK